MVTPVAHNELAAVLLWSGELNQPTDSIHDTFLAAVEDAQMPIDAILADGPHGIGPFWVRPDRVAQGPVFLIGDAAGFTDPIIGDGLASGLAAALALAGMLAAGRTDAVSRYRSWESREWLRRRSLATVTLGLVRSKVRAARALAGFSRHPEALSSFLELNDGARPLRDLKLSDWTALLGR
jgi:2-polyprenyl-6-methoxyphenol hydroxylase-like FAD-dependent oxidoreductase